MENITYKKLKHPMAFSLAEMLAALVIGSMILIAVLSVYNRLENSSNAVISKLDKSRLPREILQLITEDLDQIIADSEDTKITFQNKNEKDGFRSAKLEIIKTFYDKNNSIKDFEKIVWQTAFDYESNAYGLVLYRSRSGINLEDKLLNETKEDWQRELFVPVCSGITFFQIQTKTGTRPLPLDSWATNTLPRNVIVTVSFSPPIETMPGRWEVPEEEKITRTIALDRTRKLGFKIVKKDYDANINIADINEFEKSEDMDKLQNRNELNNDIRKID